MVKSTKRQKRTEDVRKYTKTIWKGQCNQKAKKTAKRADSQALNRTWYVTPIYVFIEQANPDKHNIT